MANIVHKKGGTLHLDPLKIRNAVLALRAVNHKLRQRIIDLLMDEDEMTVTDIYVKLRLEQSVASQQLAILRGAKVVEADRRGKFIYYQIDREGYQKLATFIDKLVNS